MKASLFSSRRATRAQRRHGAGGVAALFVLGTDPPATTVNMGATTYTWGTLFTVNQNMTLNALWFRHPAGATLQPGIWDGAGAPTPGALLGSGSGVVVSAATWTRLPFTTPVSLVAGHQYAIGVFGSTGNHYFTTYNGSGSDFVDGGATITPVKLIATNYGRYGSGSSSALSYPESAIADGFPRIFSFKLEGTVP